MTPAQRNVAGVAIFWRYNTGTRKGRRIRQLNCWGYEVAGSLNVIRRLDGQPLYLIRWVAIRKVSVDGKPTKFWINPSTGGLFPIPVPRPRDPADPWFHD